MPIASFAQVCYIHNGQFDETLTPLRDTAWSAGETSHLNASVPQNLVSCQPWGLRNLPVSNFEEFMVYMLSHDQLSSALFTS